MRRYFPQDGTRTGLRERKTIESTTWFSHGIRVAKTSSRATKAAAERQVLKVLAADPPWRRAAKDARSIGKSRKTGSKGAPHKDAIPAPKPIQNIEVPPYIPPRNFKVTLLGLSVEVLTPIITNV
jgi:hypothetical protein